MTILRFLLFATALHCVFTAIPLIKEYKEYVHTTVGTAVEHTRIQSIDAHSIALLHLIVGYICLGLGLALPPRFVLGGATVLFLLAKGHDHSWWNANLSSEQQCCRGEKFTAVFYVVLVASMVGMYVYFK